MCIVWPGSPEVIIGRNCSTNVTYKLVYVSTYVHWLILDFTDWRLIYILNIYVYLLTSTIMGSWKIEGHVLLQQIRLSVGSLMTNRKNIINIRRIFKKLNKGQQWWWCRSVHFIHKSHCWAGRRNRASLLPSSLYPLSSSSSSLLPSSSSTLSLWTALASSASPT